MITVPAYFDDAQRQATKDAGPAAPGWRCCACSTSRRPRRSRTGSTKRQNGLFAGLRPRRRDVRHHRSSCSTTGVFQVKSTGATARSAATTWTARSAERLLERDGRDRGARPRWCASRSTPPASIKHALTDASRSRSSCPSSRGRGDGRPGVEAGHRDARRARRAHRAAPGAHRRRAAAARSATRASRPRELDGVILVGGSTRVPYVRELRGRAFGKEPLGDIDPEEVVALGAAIQADILGRLDGSRGRGAPARRAAAVARHRDDGRRRRQDPARATRPSRRGRGRSSRPTRTTRPGSICTSCRASGELAADCRIARALRAEGIPPDAARAWRGSR